MTTQPFTEASSVTYSISSCSDSLMMEARHKEFVFKLLADEHGTTTIRRIRLFRVLEQPSGKISFDKLVRLVRPKATVPPPISPANPSPYHNRYNNNNNNNNNMSNTTTTTALSYLDVDDDCIVVESTEDLVDAMEQFADQRVLRLFVGDVTPSMRQKYLEAGGCSHNNNGKQHKEQQHTSNMNGTEMELAIERQIELVLEKRFRLLEQKRREQEEGGIMPMATTAIAASRGSNVGSIMRKNVHPSHQSLPPRPNSPFHKTTNAGRLPWEATEDELRPPTRARPPVSPHSQEQQYHHQQQHSFPIGGFRGEDAGLRDEPAEEDESDLYDLTVSTARNSTQASLMRPSASPSPNLSIQQQQQQQQARMTEGYFETMRNTILSNHNTNSGFGGDINNYDNDDNYDDLRDDVIDVEEEQRDERHPVRGGESQSLDYHQSPYHPNPYHRHQQHQDNGIQNSIEWENNTVDSDAELSLLLSDTDFQDRGHRDDFIASTMQPESPRFSEDQDTHRHEDGQDNNPTPSPLHSDAPTKATNNNDTKPPVAPNNTQLAAKPRPSPPKKNKLLGMLYKSE